MHKKQLDGVFKLQVLGENEKIIPNNICFTGDAIALLNNYAATGTTIHLGDWDGYKESRNGSLYYIVTDIKNADATT
ncbi:hypothetical protein [Niabella hirudinis]|uniref:hypothetical protein n=1 Tax=Niabella hirudinis TaxID=1285929 RepID=UPI003EB790A4